MSRNKDESKVKTSKSKLYDTLKKYDLTKIIESQFVDLYNKTITQNGVSGTIHTRISDGNYWFILEVKDEKN